MVYIHQLYFLALHRPAVISNFPTLGSQNTVMQNLVALGTVPRRKSGFRDMEVWSVSWHGSLVGFVPWIFQASDRKNSFVSKRFAWLEDTKLYSIPFWYSTPNQGCQKFFFHPFGPTIKQQNTTTIYSHCVWMVSIFFSIDFADYSFFLLSNLD